MGKVNWNKGFIRLCILASGVIVVIAFILLVENASTVGITFIVFIVSVVILSLFFGSLPRVIYFLAKWIAKGFKNNN